jgi:hypothetical protein
MNEKQADKRSQYEREADAAWFQALENMGLEGRARLTFQLCDELRSISMSGVKARHPEYSGRQVKLGAIKLAIGADLFRQVYPNEDVEP